MESCLMMSALMIRFLLAPLTKWARPVFNCTALHVTPLPCISGGLPVPLGVMRHRPWWRRFMPWLFDVAPTSTHRRPRTLVFMGTSFRGVRSTQLLIASLPPCRSGASCISGRPLRPRHSSLTSARSAR
jgi:hypothetical protein